MTKSIENMTFDGVDLAEEFAGSGDGQAYFIINSVGGRGVIGRENTLINVTQMDGAYPSFTRTRERILSVSITLKGETFESLRKRVERLNEILHTDGEDVPISFADESDRTYFGRVDGVSDTLEGSRIYQADIDFLCGDPFKYGEEREELLDDITPVKNKGTAPADPIFELTATGKTTFAMVSNAFDDYNLIGEPADDDVEIVDTETSVLYENGSSIDTWEESSTEMVDEHFVENLPDTIGTDDAGIRLVEYGSGTFEGLRGGSVFKEISPIQDFEIESTFDIISRREKENFRMGILFHDENMNTLGHIGIKDNSRLNKRRTPLARYGEYRGGGRSNGNLIGDTKKNDNARETTLFYLRARREGNKFTFYIGEWKSQRHIRNWEETYNDVNNDFGGKLKYISLYIANWEDRSRASRTRINSVEVFELSQVVEDQTPYILRKGDKVTFDHKDEDILVNGEPRNDLKDFGGSFFKLGREFNSLVITPEDSFESRITFRDKYL